MAPCTTSQQIRSLWVICMLKILRSYSMCFFQALEKNEVLLTGLSNPYGLYFVKVKCSSYFPSKKGGKYSRVVAGRTSEEGQYGTKLSSSDILYPISHRIQYKLSLFLYNALQNNALEYTSSISHQPIHLSTHRTAFLFILLLFMQVA